MSTTGNTNQKLLLRQNLMDEAAKRSAAGSSGGPKGGGGMAAMDVGSVAISDGSMFRIKIASPEEIMAAKQVRAARCCRRH